MYYFILKIDKLLHGNWSPIGWTGKKCDVDIDECASTPCVHGTCINGVNHYTCECHPGYTGYHCEIGN